MKEGPDISRIATLIGDPARAQMLTALMGGQALTARELAEIAGVTPQTASSHLRQLMEAGMTCDRRQGRHKYITLAGPEVGTVLEALMGLAAVKGHMRHRPGPRNADLREARRCYNHLAGRAGVQMYDSMRARGWLCLTGDGMDLTPEGRRSVAALGLDLEALQKHKAPICRDCLDWSERRSHLGGPLGREMLALMGRKGWLRRSDESRVVTFTQHGRQVFDTAFPIS